MDDKWLLNLDIKPSSVELENTKLPSNTNSNDPNSLSEVIKSLKCPVCDDVYSVPIYLCKLGHNICAECKKKMTNPQCLICKTEITAQRNILLEEIVNKYAAKCPNSKFGCKFTVADGNLKSHNSQCCFTPYLCPMKEFGIDCEWKGLYGDIRAHFQNNHPKHMTLVLGQKTIFHKFNPYTPKSDLQLITLQNGTHFTYHCDINPDTNIANWAFKKIGHESNKSQYDYEFLFCKDQRRLTIVDECLTYKIPVTLIYRIGSCVGIPLNVLNNYIDNNGNLNVIMHIKPRDKIKST